MRYDIDILVPVIIASQGRAESLKIFSRPFKVPALSDSVGEDEEAKQSESPQSQIEQASFSAGELPEDVTEDVNNDPVAMATTVRQVELDDDLSGYVDGDSDEYLTWLTFFL